MAKRKGPSEADDGSMANYDPYGGLGAKGYEKARTTPRKTADMRVQMMMAQKAGAQGNGASTAMNATAKSGINYGSS